MNQALRSTAVLVATILTSTLGNAQSTTRLSVDSNGAQVFAASSSPSISADARYVAFQSDATNLVLGDSNGVTDVFVRDRLNGTTTRVSLASSGTQGNGASSYPVISADGRFVTFRSAATNLVTGDTNAADDVFVRDLLTGTTERVSVDSSGVQGNGASGHFGDALSSDGRFVAFRSAATNLVAGDTNAALDVFVRDRANGTTERVSVATNGTQGNGISQEPSISADGRYVAFQSLATNLVNGDTNGFEDIFVRDRQLNQTFRVSLGPGGAQSNGASREPSISANGSCISFWSLASNLVASDINGVDDIFLRDRPNATTELVSISTGGVQGNSASFDPSAISADGRLVAFYSVASNLVSGDTNATTDIFLRDRLYGTTERMSVATSGTQGNGASHAPAISADGHVIAFESLATSLVAGDTNSVQDVFARERIVTIPPVDVCQPGVAGVIACPCLNPPANAPRGCDNSAVTGGARLSATDGASLALDQLVFSTNGEKPTATSILLQGNALLPAGSVFGQGVRCVGGSLRRLYVRNAVGGSISVPNLLAGEPSVSARSATLGDTISSGSERWYAVYYRDPIVLGGCIATSTFNVTQTLDVTWSP